MDMCITCVFMVYVTIPWSSLSKDGGKSVGIHGELTVFYTRCLLCHLNNLKVPMFYCC